MLLGANRLDQQLLSALSPTCLEGALILVTFTAQDDPSLTFSSNIGTLRCANVITSINVQPTAGLDSDVATEDLTIALDASAKKVSGLSLIP